MKIPINYPFVGKEEIREVTSVLSEKSLTSSAFEGGKRVQQFENLLSKFVKSKYAIAVNSGTSALQASLYAIDIKPGDEVLIPSFTFVATVEAIIEARATPVLAEIDETLNLDPNDLLKKITKKTKAVIVVHMLGVPAKLDKIKSICDKKNIALIEDTAWGCGGKYKKKIFRNLGKNWNFQF